MKKSILMIATVLIYSNTYCQTSIEQKADSLGILATQILEYKESLEELYFKTLPDNFNDFLWIFGDRNESSNYEFDGGPLYEEGMDHVMKIMLTLDDKVERPLFYKKLVDISVGGRYQADGIGVFSGLVKNKLKKDSKLFFDLLCQKTDEEIDSFWDFYVAGPHGITPPKGMDKLAADYPRILKSVERYLE